MNATPHAPHAPHAPRLRAAAAVWLLLATSVAVLMLTAAPAAAHASLIGTTPASEAVLAEAPPEVVLTFSEEVATSSDSIRVLDPDGDRADLDDLGSRPADPGAAYGVTLAADLPDGTYTVAWQVVSADSHPISGAYTFSIGAPSETSVDLSDTAVGGGLTGLLYDIARYAAYAGFLGLAGSVLFVLGCWPSAAALPAVQRLTLGGWTLLTGATLALLLLRHSYTTGEGVSLAALPEVIETRQGTALVARLLLLAAAALFVAVLYGRYARMIADGPRGAVPAGDGAGSRADGSDAAVGAPDAPVAETERRDLAFGLVLSGGILALGLAATWAMAEHASSGPQTAVAVPADIVHLLAAAGWLGGLATLLVLLFRSPVPVPGAAVRRFSAVALGSVAVLAATGLYQSWRQVRSWDALTGTSYGQLLLVKVGLVVVLIGLGWISRRWTGRLGDAAQAPEGDPEHDLVQAQDPERERVPGADRGADAGQDRGPGADGGADPVRAAQLARQRDAISRARQRRVRDADSERGGLRRSVLVETGVALLVVAVTTGLTGTPPARTAADGDAPPPVAEETGPVSLAVPFDTGGPDGAGTAYVDITPGSAGDNTLHVRTVGPDGAPLPAVELRVAVTLAAEQVGPLRFEPPLIDVGHWTQPGFVLPRPGEWELSLTIRTSDIDQVTETDTFSIG